MVIPALSNSLNDVQTACDSAVNGDIVTIPAGTGSVTWNGTLTIGNSSAGKNIQLAGPGKNALSITAGNGILINWTTASIASNPAGYTAICRDVTFFNANGYDIFHIGGLAQFFVDGSGNAKSGLRITNVRWQSDPNLTTQIAGHYLVTYGYVTGVVDHCEIDDSTHRRGAETIIVNHTRPPDGSLLPPRNLFTSPGDNGDTSWSLPYNWASEDALYFEDCIFKRVPNVIDTNSGFGGGSRFVARHNTHWGKIGGHGTRDSSGRQHGKRAGEHYNNHCVRNYGDPTENTKANGFEAHGGRSGEATFFNNYNTWLSANGIGAVDSFNITSVCVSVQPNNDYFYYGCDGCNPMDENQRANSFTFDGNTHSLDTTYNNGNTVGGKDNSTLDPGQVNSYVYGHGTGGTDNGLTISNIVVSGVGLPSTIPADYFRGFVIRVPSYSRSQQTPCCPYGFILGNTQASGAGGPITLTIESNNQTTNHLTSLQVNPGGTSPKVWEIRKVKTYFGASGAANMDSVIDESSDPVTFTSGSPNPRWTNQGTGSLYAWKNYYRIDAAPGDPATYSWTNQIVWGGVSAGNIAYQLVMNPNPIGTVRPSYPYSAATPAGAAHPETRVGADWMDTYIAEGHGLTAAQKAAYKSFYVAGSGGYTYPHPLVGGAAPPSAPSITNSPLTSTSTVGNSYSFQITATNSPTTFGASPLPANFGIDTTTGIISCSAINNVGQPGIYNINISASNAGGSDTKVLVLTLNGAPTEIRGKGRVKRIGIGARRGL